MVKIKDAGAEMLLFSSSRGSYISHKATQQHGFIRPSLRAKLQDLTSSSGATEGILPLFGKFWVVLSMTSKLNLACRIGGVQVIRASLERSSAHLQFSGSPVEGRAALYGLLL